MLEVEHIKDIKGAEHFTYLHKFITLILECSPRERSTVKLEPEKGLTNVLHHCLFLPCDFIYRVN